MRTCYHQYYNFFLLFLVTAGPSSFAQHIGSHQIETNLADRDDIIYFTDFESEDWREDWLFLNEAQNAILVDTDVNEKVSSFQGNALRVKIPKGQHYGVSAKFLFEDKIGYEPEELYVRYYVFYEDNMRNFRGKAPGFDGTYGVAGWGNKPSNGKNGWSARGQLKDLTGNSLRMSYYVYHANMTGETFGDSWHYGGEGYNIKFNKWHMIEQYCKLNTPGQNNGILRGWINGNKVFEKTNVRMRDISELKTYSYWIDYYWGGNVVASQNAHVYMDNLVIATDARIGGYSTPVGIKDPKDPTGHWAKNQNKVFFLDESRRVIGFTSPEGTATKNLTIRTLKGRRYTP